MKILLFFLLLSVSCMAGVHPVKAYSEPDHVRMISRCDTVVLQVHVAGCFSHYDQVYTFYKLAGNRRAVSYTTSSVTTTKKISRRAYKKFVAHFDKSYQHFRSRENTIHCTTVSSYKLSGGEQLVTFSNTSCEADYEPERYLKKLLN